MGLIRAVAIWGALTLSLALPLTLALQSPLLAWREPVYIIAGFAGVSGLGLLLLQPLLALGLLPGLRGRAGRRAHRWIGVALILAIAVHVAGLWLTSPPDVVDALLLVSPTPFSVWGVLAMWAVIGAAIWALLRRRVRPRLWRMTHGGLAVVTVIGTVTHAILIEGTMEPVSKTLLCLLVIGALGWAIRDRGLWPGRLAAGQAAPVASAKSDRT